MTAGTANCAVRLTRYRGSKYIFAISRSSAPNCTRNHVRFAGSGGTTGGRSTAPLGAGSVGGDVFGLDRPRQDAAGPCNVSQSRDHPLRDGFFRGHGFAQFADRRFEFPHALLERATPTVRPRRGGFGVVRRVDHSLSLAAEGPVTIVAGPGSTYFSTIGLALSAVGNSFGSGIVTFPVAAHSVPRNSVAANPWHRIAVTSWPIGVWNTRPLP